jgi:hypothetical protein
MHQRPSKTVSLTIQRHSLVQAGCYIGHHDHRMFLTSVSAAGICHAALIFTTANAPAPLKNSHLDNLKTLTCSSWVLRWS